MMNNVKTNCSKRGLRLGCFMETGKQKTFRYLDLIHRKSCSVPASTEKSQYEAHSNYFCLSANAIKKGSLMTCTNNPVFHANHRICMKTQSPFSKQPSVMLAAMDKTSAATAAAMNIPVTPVKFKKPLYFLVQALANPKKIWSQRKILRLSQKQKAIYSSTCAHQLKKTETRKEKLKDSLLHLQVRIKL